MNVPQWTMIVVGPIIYVCIFNDNGDNGGNRFSCCMEIGLLRKKKFSLDKPVVAFPALTHGDVICNGSSMSWNEQLHKKWKHEHAIACSKEMVKESNPRRVQHSGKSGFLAEISLGLGVTW